MRAQIYPQRMTEPKLWAALDQRLGILASHEAVKGYSFRERVFFAKEAQMIAAELALRGHQLALEV